MTIFWFYAGLLCLTALAFVLPPQLRPARKHVDTNRTRVSVGFYREHLRELEVQRDAGTVDTAQIEAARVEAARTLLDDVHGPEQAAHAPLGRAIPLVAGLLVPVLAWVLYLHWGSLDRLMPANQHAGQAAQNIEKITTQLEALLATTPDSAEGWSLMGRAYMAEERAADAARAFERAATLAGRPSQLLGRWAEALYSAGGRQWTPELRALTGEALASNPQEATTLRLLGLAAFEAGRYTEAAAYWKRLLAAQPEGAPSRAAIVNDIARARELEKSEASKGASP